LVFFLSDILRKKKLAFYWVTTSFLDCGIEGAVHMSRLEKRLTTLFGLLLSPLYLLEERERNEKMQERINRLARKTSNFES